MLNLITCISCSKCFKRVKRVERLACILEFMLLKQHNLLSNLALANRGGVVAICVRASRKSTHKSQNPHRLPTAPFVAQGKREDGPAKIVSRLKSGPLARRMSGNAGCWRQEAPGADLKIGHYTTGAGFSIGFEASHEQGRCSVGDDGR